MERNDKELVNIKVFGVGGGGSNAVVRMFDPSITTVEYYILNTDKQALETPEAQVIGDNRIYLGAELTRGLGAGAKPEVGRKSAEESKDTIKEKMEGADMIFVAAGMGGGTGTGAAAVVASIAKELKILTVGVVTKPFEFEGRKKIRQAEEGIKELEQFCDTLITIPNDKLVKIEDANITFVDACKLADQVLKESIQGISDLIVMPGMINVDFADVCSTLTNKGTAHVGIGTASDAMSAVQKAIDSDILETTIDGSTGLLINFSSGDINNLNLKDVTSASRYAEQKVDEDANIIFGTSICPELGTDIKVTVIATGFDVEAQKNNGVAPQKNEVEEDETETEVREVSVEKEPKIQRRELPSFVLNNY